MKKTGFMIGRFMPLHNGHIEAINTAAKQVNQLIVLVGSMGVRNERNPFTIQERLKMINECNEFWEKDKITLIPIFDLTNENDSSLEWGNYLYNTVTKITNCELLKYFTSESEEKMMKWFGNNKKLNIIYFERFSNISATKIRESINGDGRHFLNNCPENVIKYILNEA